MKQVFRTTRKHWIGDAFLLLSEVILVLLVLWTNQAFFAIVLLLSVPITLYSSYKRFLSRLEIDEESIFSFEKGQEIKIKWNDVLSIQLHETFSIPNKVLVIDSSEGVTAIPLDHFNYEAIWQRIKLVAPSSALEKDAYRKTSGYQEWLSQAQETNKSITTPFQISDHWLAKVAGWGTMIFAAALLYGLWEPGKPSIWGGVIFSLVFFPLGLYAVLTTGKLQIDKNAITRVTPLGKYQINWEEVTHIEQDAYGALIFYGLDKYLAIYGPGWWSGKQKLAMADFLFAEIELRKIEIKHIRVSLKMSKNTKVR